MGSSGCIRSAARSWLPRPAVNGLGWAIAAEQLDSYQRDIAKGLSKAFDDEATEEHELDLEAARLVVFSDHHKGARDGADDFRSCERAYMAALGYYLEEGHRLYVLGDVEELWENSPDEPLEAYADALRLEAEFHRQGRYERFWGNHDDYWGDPGHVEKRLWHYYPELRVREALKLRVRSGDETVGLLFLVHGHQGTVESQRFAWFSKLVVRYLWRPLQRRFGFSATTPATDWELRARHNQALFAWARSHPQRPVLIAGHTHKPVFGTSKPPKPEHRPLSEVQAELAAAEANSPVDRDDVARLRAEVGWIEAIERSTEPAPIPIEPPCYFNTGCCSFPDGDVTGLEIADGRIRLVRWPDNEGNALPEVLVEDDIREIFAKLGGPV